MNDDPAVPTPRVNAALGFGLALVALAVDQALKYWLLTIVDLARAGPIQLAGFLELVLVWNRGISYGLFSQNSDIGRWILVVLSAVAIIALSIWLMRARGPIVHVGLGLIIGGAAGNAIDRIVHGAVADFFHFHFDNFSWYVFNLADTWIVVGVLILLYDSAFRRP